MLTWDINSLRPTSYSNVNDPVSLAFDWYKKLNLSLSQSENEWAQRNQLLIAKAMEILMNQEKYHLQPSNAARNLTSALANGLHLNNGTRQQTLNSQNGSVNPVDSIVARPSKSFVAEHPDVFLASCIVMPRRHDKFVPRNPDAVFPDFFEDDPPVVLPFVPANKEGFDRTVYPMPIYNDGREPTSISTERVVGHTCRPPPDPHSKPPPVNPKTGMPFVKFEYLQTREGWTRKVEEFLALNPELLIPVKRNRKARR